MEATIRRLRDYTENGAGLDLVLVFEVGSLYFVLCTLNRALVQVEIHRLSTNKVQRTEFKDQSPKT